MAASSRVDDERLIRIAGVRSAYVDDARQLLANLDRAPTMPAAQRYRGVVHGNATLADRDPATIADRVLIVSALLGLVRPDEMVPDYRLEFSASLDGIGGLATFWRNEVTELLLQRVRGAIVWDLLPAEHARILPTNRVDLGQSAHATVAFRFVTPQGRAANAARTKLAKGRIAACLLNDPALTPEQLVEEVELDDGWILSVEALAQASGSPAGSPSGPTSVVTAIWSE